MCAVLCCAVAVHLVQGLELAPLPPDKGVSNRHLTACCLCAACVLQDEFTYDTAGHAVLGRAPNSPVPPKRVLADIISFRRVALDAPDGMPLVRGDGAGGWGSIAGWCLSYAGADVFS